MSVDGGRRRKTYLIALARRRHAAWSRYAAFALSENTVSAFCPVLEQAVMRRGIPKRLYVDNGSAFRSHHLALVCAKLGITLDPRPALSAAGQRQAGALVPHRPHAASADAAPRRTSPRSTRSTAALWAWVEGEYHHAPHRGLDGMTPARRLGLAPRTSVRMPAAARSARAVSLRAEAQGAQGPHRQLDGIALRGRRRARRRDRPRCASTRRTAARPSTCGTGAKRSRRRARRRLRQLLRQAQSRLRSSSNPGAVLTSRRPRFG